MSYATTEQVNRLLGPHRATTETPVTTGDIDQIRVLIASRINAVLKAAGVSVVPVVEASLAEYLATVEAWGSAAHVLKALFPETSGQGEQPAFGYWQSLFDKAIKDLPDLVDWYVTSGLLESVHQSMNASSYFTNNPDKEAELGSLEGANLFKVDNLGAEPW